MNVRSRWLQWCAVLAFVLLPLATPAHSLADNAEEEALREGRIEGYEKTVLLTDTGGTGLTWLFLIALSVVAVGVMFKDAKRTHLD